MCDPVDSSGMPLRGTDSVPHFAGNYRQLINFLESVERLAQPLGLTDKEIIKQLLSYYEGCGVCHYTRQIFEKPATIEAPLASTPPQPDRAQEQPEAAIIAPISEVYDAIPAPVAQETHQLEVQDTTPLPLAPMSQSDLVPPAAPELQYATPVDQSTPLDDPRITDKTALFNDSSSCPSAECPSVASDAHHMDHVPDDQDAYLDHARTTPEDMRSHVLTLSRSKAPIAMLPHVAYQAVQDNVLDDLHALLLSAQCAFNIWKLYIFVTDTILILASPCTPHQAYFKHLAADYRQPDVHACALDTLQALSDPLPSPNLHHPPHPNPHSVSPTIPCKHGVSPL
ncbi:hypothetical protein F4604DRAFT_1685971 [Suillus subluteus]|nr:hypothetical protein F4604DRAFT_1685971 [Suillus subluteus]